MASNTPVHFSCPQSGSRRNTLAISLGLALALPALAAHAQSTAADGPITDFGTVRVTAEAIARQALGTSIITAEDIERQPPRNDLSELLRTMPGINLTGNSTSGQRGNHRQIDIRGMGPENTLILVDGKPVGSRNSVRFGWRGERDTRGDTNWVPASQVERVEVLRGPAAARYGNGAAGGVVNIVTRHPDEEFAGNASMYFNQPHHGVDGDTRRAGFGLSGPLNDRWAFRLYGSANRTDGDDYAINRDYASERTGANAGSFPAGREGVRNRDLNGLLAWDLAPGHRIDFGASYSRQGNIYVGDSQNTNSNPEVLAQIGKETNRSYRRSFDITHRGEYGDSTRSLSYVALEDTRNIRLLEGLAGGTEGIFLIDGGFGDIDLRTLTAHAELNHTIIGAGADHVLTFGVEWVDSKLEDNASALNERNPQRVPPSPFPWEGTAQARIASAFVEDNIYLGDAFTLTPGLRFDHHDAYGGNWSPSLNASWMFAPDWSLRAGIARAYKAPNLYQGNPGYALYSNGIGCWGGGGACFLVGNDNLDVETSINKELGVQYDGAVQATLTWFRNDYRNKVEAGHAIVAEHMGADVFQWDNVPRAVVEGFEGSLALALTDRLQWRTNLTWMLRSENRTTGDYLSVIPEYTANVALDWQATDRFSLLARTTFFGEQKPQKLDYHGDPVTGSAADRMPAYALAGVSGRYQLSDTVSLVAGIDNLFDKRIFRRGNASGVNLGTPNEIHGAGAWTYNEPGRSYFVSMNVDF